MLKVFDVSFIDNQAEYIGIPDLMLANRTKLTPV